MANENPATALAYYARKVAETENKIAKHQHLAGVFCHEIYEWRRMLRGYRGRVTHWKKVLAK